MSQEIIKIEDIVGGDNLVKKQELDEFLKKNDVGTAASKDEDYFAKSDEIPPLPQYTLEIKREDIVWTDDYITIPHSTYLRDKKIEVYKALLRKGSGDIILNPRVSYPRSEYYNSTPPNEFYLKDGDGYITKSTDFEYLYIEYSIFQSAELNNYDIRKEIGENVVQDESPGATYHSREMRKVFLACYPELWAQYGIESVESLNDPLAGNRAINASFEPKYMELKKANMLFRPYVNGALSEQTGSNPNILKVGAHYGNWGQFGGQQEVNITSADDEFLTNVIAVAARVDDTVTTELQTTYGRGVEFFEDITALDVEFPDKVYFLALAGIYTDVAGLILYSTEHPEFTEMTEVGEQVTIVYGSSEDPSTHEISEVAEILSPNSLRLATPITPILSGVKYVWHYTTIGTAMRYNQQQSPTCSIVGAKLKKIKLLSGANWQVVREAARMTAKKTIDGIFDNYPGHWDKFRGFGKIQPDDAIQYIKDNYTENSDWIAALADDVDRTRGINPMLPYGSISDNTPVPKRLMHEVTENNYTDEDKAKLDAYPELTGVASDGFVNAAGEIQQITAVHHRILGAKNEELAYQHVDTTKIKETLTDDDSIAILNNVTGEVIVTPLTDLYNYIINKINA